MWFFFKRLIERLITLVIFAVIGAAIVGGMGSGAEDAVIAGALMGAGLVIAYWILAGLFRRIFRRVGKNELATIVDITSEPPPGAPWYHHTYVLFDVRGKRRRLKLTPEQAKYFSDHYSVNDTGHLVWSGKKLIEFGLPTAERPAVSVPFSGKRRRVFISYAHGDDPGGQVAEYLEQVFSAAGLDTWVDRKELEPGDKLRKRIEQQIRGADYFVPVLSVAYMTSPWCLNEFELAADAAIEIIPVKITAGRLLPPPDMQRLFEQKAGEPLYLDLSARGYLNELRELAARMAATP